MYAKGASKYMKVCVLQTDLTNHIDIMMTEGEVAYLQREYAEKKAQEHDTDINISERAKAACAELELVAHRFGLQRGLDAYVGSNLTIH